eukprot:TRINITY_DN11185_c0_g1_i1.p1 TRINITY_DN11185_c0_g1~~TRINITY_DN11185_c0_g1_i1.p1  ORF type:complete len:230 (-),score=56.85 TRINITY_DN11185_c0_g1_i1:64-753(-)
MDACHKFRQKARLDVDPDYSGVRHICTCLAIAFTSIAALIGLFFLSSAAVSILSAIPAALITFLICNGFEYYIHRYALHPFGQQTRHSHLHHRFFTISNMQAQEVNDAHLILFHPRLVLFIFLAVIFPLTLVVSLVASAKIGAVCGIVAALYYINYEVLHLAYHSDADSALVRYIPCIERLREIHAVHHDPILMRSHNFNITYPIMDWLVGTLHPFGAQKQMTTHKITK